MTDYLFAMTGPQDVQLGTGRGHLAGVVVTTTEATPGACQVYDYAGAGPPTGDTIFVVVVNNQYEVTHLFNDRYAPRFADGAWLHLSDDCYAMLWVHIPDV